MLIFVMLTFNLQLDFHLLVIGRDLMIYDY